VGGETPKRELGGEEGYGEREGWYNEDEIKGDYVCAVMEVLVG
jgi:hypothetical protein